MSMKRAEEDPILKHIGEFGLWQGLVICLGIVTPSVFLVTWQVLVMAFHSLPVDFVCEPKIADKQDAILFANYSFTDWKNSFPNMSQCESMIVKPINRESINRTLLYTGEKCDRWIFDTSFYPSTIVTDVRISFFS